MNPEQDAYRDACLREAYLALGEAIVRERLLVQEAHRLTARVAELELSRYQTTPPKAGESTTIPA